MSRIEEKLQHFANDIMADVGEERRVLVEQVDKELRDIYIAKENEYLKEAYDIIQNALVMIDQKKNASLSRINMSNRTKLFEKRSEILSDVYSRVVDELKAFKKTDDYKKYLIKKVNSSIALLGEGDIWIKLDYSDRDLKDYIEKATGYSVEIESKKVELIGGCIVHNKDTQTIADNSFSRKLEDAKSEFAQQCQLEID